MNRKVKRKVKKQTKAKPAKLTREEQLLTKLNLNSAKVFRGEDHEDDEAFLPSVDPQTEKSIFAKTIIMEVIDEFLKEHKAEILSRAEKLAELRRSAKGA